jgi:hypothetical protein
MYQDPGLGSQNPGILSQDPRSMVLGPRSLTRGPRSLGHGLQVACCAVQVTNYRVQSQLLVSGSKMLQFTGQSKETCNRLLVAGLSRGSKAVFTDYSYHKHVTGRKGHRLQDSGH